MNKSKLIILHGENQLASRKALQQIIDESRAEGTEIVRLDARSLSVAQLENALQSQSLFATPKLVVVEELHSLPRSKRKDGLIELIKQADVVSVVLWEKRSLTKTMLKKFEGGKATEFKLSKALFKWLDVWGQPARTVLPLQRTVFEQDGPQLALAMLARQVRLLLETKAGLAPAAPPFALTRLKTQAQHFQLSELLALHKNLLELDVAEKTSANQLTLEQALDLLASKY